jgi:hypothetical protein
MKMSSGEKMIFAAHFSYMLKNSRSCTVADCINDAAAAVKLFRESDTTKLSEAAQGMWLKMCVDDLRVTEKDC